MAVLFWMALAGPVAGACDDLGALLGSAEQAVLEGRLDDATALQARMEAALACGPVTPPPLLARMWRTDGARAALQGDRKRAVLALTAAHRVAPDLDMAAWPAPVREAWQEAKGSFASEGTVRVHPDPTGYVAVLDGVATTFPTEAPEGLHVVQVGTSADQVAFAQVFYLPPKDTFFILTGLEPRPEPPAVTQVPPEIPAPLPEPLPPPASPRERSDHPGFIVAGGAAAALAMGTAWLAWSQNGHMETAPSLDALDAAYARQKAWAGATYGLLGLAAVGVGVHLAF